MFICVFCSALLGLYLRTRLPEHHLGDELIGPVTLAVGLISTMAALVLGLLVSSAKSSFDTVNSEIVRTAASIILFDRVRPSMARKRKELRDLLKQRIGKSTQVLASGESAQIAQFRGLEALRGAENVQLKLEALSPRSDAQRQLQASAIRIASDALAARQLTMLQAAARPPYHC